MPALLLVFIVEGTTHIDTFAWIDQTDKIAMQAQIPILIIGVAIFVLGIFSHTTLQRTDLKKLIYKNVKNKYI